MAGPQQQTFTNITPIAPPQTFTDVAPIGDAPPEEQNLVQKWISNPSTVPNARIRNMPNPVDPSWSPGRALYEGAKTGIELGSIPATIGQPIGTVVRGAIGATLGGAGAKTIANAAGAGEFGQEVAGDVGSLAGGALAVTGPGARVGKVAGKVAKGTLEDIPGVRQFGKLREYWDQTAPKPTPEPAAPPPAAALARGAQPYQDPAAGLGKIPVRGSLAGSLAESVAKPQTSAPMQRGSLSKMMNDIQAGVEKGTGAAPPPNPKAPIYQRGGISTAMQEGTADMPEGHTPHQSSALRSSMYDPNANEFHARMTSGDTTYVYGDVSPDEAKAFTDAGSKGSAYQQIKNGHPLVAKIVNGKRVAVKATQ